MRTLIVTCVTAVALLVPATASADAPDPTKADRSAAAKDCRAERDEIGVEAFREKYGTNKNKRNAFGKCVSEGAREEAQERVAEQRAAAKDCRAERDEIGVEAFREKYGTNKNKRNAFGKCVSETVKHDDEPEV